ncbi:hypothetical protein PFICI_10089 [Pestalotiopsis fici W106-1]|uniref:N-acetyltransferase domain-containing protein n=1 Tax=Pestalotiopsis fici (strain W106-1 / CGMCC3.15140) TaxID=1229662 RepID=W3WXZ8_PESFW|nr:uncharacterized protein PFICI_10089 [Pestalotiopsis fici W106-1]ETS78027.1 hypothetical protein PFICI_10089 [Pestalotiopsis fici W106-1]
MPLQVQPLELPDFDILISHASSDPPGDDLVAPPNPVAWPVSTQAEAQTRARHCFALQRRRFLRDPTTNFVKVVDVDNNGAAAAGDIIAVARWHFYPQGYDYSTEAHWEMAPTAPLMAYLRGHKAKRQGETANDNHPQDRPEGSEGLEGYNDDDNVYPPPNFNLALHNHILSSRDSFRPTWVPDRHPCWVLMHLVTRPSQRRRGAAGLLIRWGLERAREMGVDAYLEAGVQGRPVYLKFGFEQVGPDRRVDLRDHVGEAAGVPSEFVLANMKWSPKGQAGKSSDGDE